MTLRILCCLGLALCCWAAATGPEVAQRLAERAKAARGSGEIARAYLLYAEAAQRDPRNPNYAANRDALRSSYELLSRTLLDKADISADIKAAEMDTVETGPSAITPTPLIRYSTDLLSLPRINVSSAQHDFDVRADETTLIQKICEVYGVRAIWDPELSNQKNIEYKVTGADFRTAMEALTSATNTFVFPISPTSLFFARDTEEKRNQYEPTILLTVPLPDSIGEKDLIEAANAVRSVLNLRSFGWDSVSRVIFVRDKVTKALAARSLLDALLLPHGQVSLEVEVLTLNSDINYHYGAALQTTFQLLTFGNFAHFKTLLGPLGAATSFFTFGGASAILGVGITNSTFFATYSKSFTRTSYDATVVASDGQPASLHVGEKYPIPQSLYTGASTSSTPSIYNPIGQFTLEDLGLGLKLTPRVNGKGEIALEIEAEFESLGADTYNTVPAVDERKFTGNVVLREGEWAILAGLDQDSASKTRNGLFGLSNIPGLNQVLSENTRDNAISNTLVVIKPTINRLPMSSAISPQYLLGPVRGVKVML